MPEENAVLVSFDTSVAFKKNALGSDVIDSLGLAICIADGVQMLMESVSSECQGSDENRKAVISTLNMLCGIFGERANRQWAQSV